MLMPHPVPVSGRQTPRSPRSWLRLALCCTLILATWGCQSTPNLPGLSPGRALETGSQTPEMLVRAAARANVQEAARLYLAAADGFIERGDWPSAAEALAAVSPGQITTLGNRYALTSSAVALYFDRTGEAAAWLAQVADPTADELNRLLQLQSRVCAAEANYVCAAERLIESQGLAPETEDRQVVHDQIWRYLSQAPASLAASRGQHTRGALAGWWSLKAASEQGFSAQDQRSALLDWRNRHPAHPAQFPWPTAVTEILQPTWIPDHIALLLPLSGKLASAGMAVRDGFVAAYLHAESDRRISVFDSAQGDIGATYQAARQAGADLIIGPLAKEDVQALNALAPAVPVLALNYLPEQDTPATGLFQFGLAIEDEADTLAERLLGDGAERVLVIYSREDWAGRAAERIREQWPHHLTEERFDSIKTLTEAVGRGMFVDTSTARNLALGRLLRQRLEHVPRARTDLDAVVALVNHTEATALRPALRYHFGDHLPIYASSQAARGATQDDLRALSGFRIAEFPWLVYQDPFARSVQESFGLDGNPLSSLYALGADAFSLSERFSVFRANSSLNVLGATGVLSVDDSGRFHRELAWSLVRDGLLTALPFVVAD